MFETEMYRPIGTTNFGAFGIDERRKAVKLLTALLEEGDYPEGFQCDDDFEIVELMLDMDNEVFFLNGRGSHKCMLNASGKLALVPVEDEEEAK